MSALVTTRQAPRAGRFGELRLAGVLFRGDPAPTWPGAWDFLADYPEHVADGVAVYALTDCPAWQGATHYLRQPFHRVARTDPAHGHVWAWNGGRALYDPSDPEQIAKRITLAPSFAWNVGKDPAWPYVHLYLRDGRLVDAGDSTATFTEGP